MLLPLLVREHAFVVHRVPYSSITQFFEYYSTQTPDLRFGLSCVFQAFELQRRLHANGIDTTKLIVDGRHAAVVCWLEDRVYLLDPYLLHMEPVDLTAVAEGCGQQDFPAYPLQSLDGGVGHSILRVRHASGSNTVSLQLMRLSPSGRCSLSRYFQLTLDRVLPSKPNPETVRPMLYHPEQNNLSIRVVCDKSGVVRDLIYPVCYYHGDHDIAEERLVLRTSVSGVLPYGEHGEFQRELGALSALVGVSPDELIEHVLCGVRIYEAHAPANIAYHPYADYQPPGYARPAAMESQ